ncbi:MAG: NAD(P)H-binding protein [Roseiarcus sp.]
MTIGVTAATGHLGRLGVEKLKGKTGGAIIALVRSPAKASGLGIAVREADYTKPATLKAALAGVYTLLL